VEAVYIFFNYHLHLHLIQIIGMEENLSQVEPIWISEEKQEHLPQVEPIWIFEEKQEHLPQVEPSWIPQIGMEFGSLSNADIFWKYYGTRMFLAQERNMRTSANKMELLHLVGLCVQSKV
jgi:hypothetical protein